ncbi:MAG: hypothetical protein PHR16_04245 [Methylovulum sp.]|nr:hypothetical protein [Methylovulum sp.]
MLLKRFFLVICLSAALTGCAEFYAGNSPAPVFNGAGAEVYHQPIPRPIIQEPSVPETIVETQPLDTGTPIAPIEITPEQASPEQEQELSELEQALQPKPESQAIPAPEATEVPQPTMAPPPPPPFEPLQSFAPLSPGVGALVLAANKTAGQGDINSATTTIERAIRIEPRNATLFYKLALLRLKQSKPRLAEDLAKKSALLASGDKQLKKHSWLLIARARDMQNNPEGAKEARAKADQF